MQIKMVMYFVLEKTTEKLPNNDFGGVIKYHLSAINAQVPQDTTRTSQIKLRIS